MKQFKNLFTAGCCVLIMIVAMILQNANLSRTVDFSGEIHRINISESGTVTVCAFSDTVGFQLFKVDGNSRLENLDGEKIEIEDLTKGTKVLVTYKKTLFKDEDVYTAKKLKAVI